MRQIERQIDQRTAAKSLFRHQCSHLDDTGKWNPVVRYVGDIVVRQWFSEEERGTNDALISDCLQALTLLRLELLTEIGDGRGWNRQDDCVEGRLGAFR